MKALTIWQPWATLIMVGAKPFEFRGWPATAWLIGEEMAIHAGARKMKAEEIEDLIERLNDGRDAWTTGLFKDKAMPVLERALRQATEKRPKAAVVSDLFGAALPADLPPLEYESLPYSAGLGVVRIGQPINGNDTAATFGHRINDSDRMKHSNWGWPMLDVRPFDQPFAIAGAQGLWDWPDAERMAG